MSSDWRAILRRCSDDDTAHESDTERRRVPPRYGYYHDVNDGGNRRWSSYCGLPIMLACIWNVWSWLSPTVGTANISNSSPNFNMASFKKGATNCTIPPQPHQQQQQPLRNRLRNIAYQSQHRPPVVKRSENAPVTMQGWLYKQGSEGLMLWKRRWFVLSEYCLYYYKCPDEQKLLGSLMLPSYKISPCSDVEGKLFRKKYSFKAEHANMRTYYFAADTRELMVQWMNALSLASILQENTGFGDGRKPALSFNRRVHSLEHSSSSNSSSYNNSSANSNNNNNNSNNNVSNIFDNNNNGKLKQEKRTPSGSSPAAEKYTDADISQMITCGSASNGWRLNNLAAEDSARNNAAIVQQQQQQPLYANAPPKPRRLTESSEQSPDRLCEDSIRQLKEYTIGSDRIYPSQYAKETDTVNESSRLMMLSSDTNNNNNSDPRRTPETYGRSFPSYSKFQMTNSAAYLTAAGTTDEQQQKNAANSSEYEELFNLTSSSSIAAANVYRGTDSSFVTNNSSVVSPVRDFPSSSCNQQQPRPHSADFLEHDSSSRKFSSSGPSNNSVAVDRTNYRPKSSIGLLPINGGSNNSLDSFHWSEESYAQKMRKTAAPYFATKATTVSNGSIMNTVTTVTATTTSTTTTTTTTSTSVASATTSTSLLTATVLKGGAAGVVSIPDGYNQSSTWCADNIRISQNPLAEYERRWSNYSSSPLVVDDGGRTGEFVRSVSARIPREKTNIAGDYNSGTTATANDLDERLIHRHSRNSRRASLHHSRESNHNSQQREESMRRLLEWKQRMLQSPLTRKSNNRGSPSNRDLAQNLLSRSGGGSSAKENSPPIVEDEASSPTTVNVVIPTVSYSKSGWSEQNRSDGSWDLTTAVQNDRLKTVIAAECKGAAAQTGQHHHRRSRSRDFSYSEDRSGRSKHGRTHHRSRSRDEPTQSSTTSWVENNRGGSRHHHHHHHHNHHNQQQHHHNRRNEHRRHHHRSRSRDDHQVSYEYPSMDVISAGHDGVGKHRRRHSKSRSRDGSAYNNSSNVNINNNRKHRDSRYHEDEQLYDEMMSTPIDGRYRNISTTDEERLDNHGEDSKTPTASRRCCRTDSFSSHSSCCSSLSSSSSSSPRCSKSLSDAISDYEADVSSMVVVATTPTAADETDKNNRRDRFATTNNNNNNNNNNNIIYQQQQQNDLQQSASCKDVPSTDDKRTIFADNTSGSNSLDNEEMLTLSSKHSDSGYDTLKRAMALKSGVVENELITRRSVSSGKDCDETDQDNSKRIIRNRIKVFQEESTTTNNNNNNNNRAVDAVWKDNKIQMRQPLDYSNHYHSNQAQVSQLKNNNKFPSSEETNYEYNENKALRRRRRGIDGKSYPYDSSTDGDGTVSHSTGYNSGDMNHSDEDGNNFNNNNNKDIVDNKKTMLDVDPDQDSTRSVDHRSAISTVYADAGYASFIVKNNNNKPSDDATENHYMSMVRRRTFDSKTAANSSSNSLFSHSRTDSAASSASQVLIMETILSSSEADAENSYIDMVMNNNNNKPTTNDDSNNNNNNHYEFLYKMSNTTAIKSSSKDEQPIYLEVTTTTTTTTNNNNSVPRCSTLPDILNSSNSAGGKIMRGKNKNSSTKSEDSSDADDEASKDLCDDHHIIQRLPRFSLSDTFRPASYYLGGGFNSSGMLNHNHSNTNNNNDNDDGGDNNIGGGSEQPDSSSDSDLVSPPPIPTSPPPMEDDESPQMLCYEKDRMPKENSEQDGSIRNLRNILTREAGDGSASNLLEEVNKTMVDEQLSSKYHHLSVDDNVRRSTIDPARPYRLDITSSCDSIENGHRYQQSSSGGIGGGSPPYYYGDLLLLSSSNLSSKKNFQTPTVVELNNQRELSTAIDHIKSNNVGRKVNRIEDNNDIGKPISAKLVEEMRNTVKMIDGLTDKGTLDEKNIYSSEIFHNINKLSYRSQTPEPLSDYSKKNLYTANKNNDAPSKNIGNSRSSSLARRSRSLERLLDAEEERVANNNNNDNDIINNNNDNCPPPLRYGNALRAGTAGSNVVRFGAATTSSENNITGVVRQSRSLEDLDIDHHHSKGSNKSTTSGRQSADILSSGSRAVVNAPIPIPIPVPVPLPIPIAIATKKITRDVTYVNDCVSAQLMRKVKQSPPKEYTEDYRDVRKIRRQIRSANDAMLDDGVHYERLNPRATVLSAPAAGTCPTSASSTTATTTATNSASASSDDTRRSTVLSDKSPREHGKTNKQPKTGSQSFLEEGMYPIRPPSSSAAFEIDREKLRQWDLMSSAPVAMLNAAQKSHQQQQLQSTALVKELAEVTTTTTTAATTTIEPNRSSSAAVDLHLQIKEDNTIRQSSLVSGSSSAIGRDHHHHLTPFQTSAARLPQVSPPPLQQQQHHPHHHHHQYATGSTTAAISNSSIEKTGIENTSSSNHFFGNNMSSTNDPLRSPSRLTGSAADFYNIKAESSWNLTVSAGELLGRTHEELVLLLIQLRRQSATLCKAMESCHREIQNQGKLAELNSDDRSEHLRNLEEMRKKLMELERQYEKGKPLVNLVDNMVKLGSLFRSTNLTDNGLTTDLREKLQFNHKVQEQRMLAEERKDWERISPDHNQLQAKVEELYRLDKLLQQESSTLQCLKQDKEMLENALGGLKYKLQGIRENPNEIERYRRQQHLLERELSHVRSVLARNSKKLEETAAANGRLEAELVILRQKLQWNSRSNEAGVAAVAGFNCAPSIGALESELKRVQMLVGDLQRQRYELSSQVRQLTEKSQSLSQQIRPPSSGLTTANLTGSCALDSVTSSKRKTGSGWMETDLDNEHSHDLATDYSPSSHYAIVPPIINNSSTNLVNGLCVNSSNFVGKNGIELASSNYCITDYDHDDNIPPPAPETQYCRPFDINEADDRMKRYYGILPREKPQEIKTVRIVKRESERRQRDRDRTGNIGIPISSGTATTGKQRMSVLDELNMSPQMQLDNNSLSKLSEERTEDDDLMNDEFLLGTTSVFLTPVSSSSIPRNTYGGSNIDEDNNNNHHHYYNHNNNNNNNNNNNYNFHHYHSNNNNNNNKTNIGSSSSSSRQYMTDNNNVSFMEPLQLSDRFDGTSVAQNVPLKYTMQEIKDSSSSHSLYRTSSSGYESSFYSDNSSGGTTRVSNSLPRKGEPGRKEDYNIVSYRNDGKSSTTTLPFSCAYQSEAAKQIIQELSAADTRHIPTTPVTSALTSKDYVSKRLIPREKRRHHTVSSSKPIITLTDTLGVSARARDDVDMERALRPRYNGTPDVVRSTLARSDNVKYNADTIDSLLGTPSKIRIPERYVPENIPQLSAEEQDKRLKKADAIRKMLSESTTSVTAAQGAENELEDASMKKKLTEEREHLLQLNQILAQQVMEKSKRVAERALAELPLSSSASTNGSDELSPSQSVPVSQQRENYFS